MKILDLKELKRMDPEKLKELLQETERAVFETKFELTTGSKNSHQVKNGRKQIARIKTLLNPNHEK